MPKVSVILPVYNGEKYLKEAIDSILNQTFTDFEVLVMNDGSTDGSAAIIDAYSDKRIVHIRNEANKGLIYTLNKAIELAKGEYIARMDADDIALPHRLEKQTEFLDKNPHVGIIATTIEFIDQLKNKAGFWEVDRKTIGFKEICYRMPRENCLAHPTIMGRRYVFLKFKYHQDQKNIEDYDLWLRMLADGVIIEKIPETLLLYRVHQGSVTQSSKNKALPTLRVFICKRKYLIQQFREGKLTTFNLRVFFHMLIDGITVLKKKLTF